MWKLKIIGDMLTTKLKGTHGTCASFAENIRKNGFNLGNGRRGSGVYFWAYNGESKFNATCLAEAWWQHSFNYGFYSKEANQSFELITTEINTENFLDLEEHDFKLKLLEFVSKVYARALKKDRKGLAERAYDLFVDQIEKQIGKVDVIHVTVNPPSKECFSQKCFDRGAVTTEAISPSCYVVRNTKCITIN
jgi:hypothetical protein